MQIYDEVFNTACLKIEILVHVYRNTLKLALEVILIGTL